MFCVKMPWYSQYILLKDKLKNFGREILVVYEILGDSEL